MNATEIPPILAPPTATWSGKCRILVIVRKGRPHLVADFKRIGEYIRQLDVSVELKVVHDLPHTWLRPAVWSRPTLSIAPRRLLMFRPLRGPVYQCWPHTKIAEYRRLDAAGIPVPDWRILGPRSTPDLSSFGRIVVVKPAAGGRGEGVRLMRSDAVRYERPTNQSARLCHDLVVQRFVYTGPWAAAYRVTTFFGKVLFADITEADHSHPPLPHPDELGNETTIDPTALYPSRKPRKMRLIDDADVLELAERAHRLAFADNPLLGIDIIREHGTGKLYVMEVNSGGSTWHFSSRTGRIIQETFGFRYESQFDGFRKAAKILVDQTRREAW
jgi:hypothetical protein